jgi:hypothetical protein
LRDLESIPAVRAYLSTTDPQHKRQFEQSIAVLVRMTMEHLGWQVISQ